MTATAASTSYDQVPYTSLPIPNTHVGRMAAVAALLGRACAPADRCRVLEIGCASGVNLMAMAQQLPESEFLGIDASARQIEAGRALAAQAGIGNLRLEPLSVAQAGEDLGQFDYFICHGVYSWVSTETQEQILRAVKERLAPQGIALVSYNVLPGWAVPAELRRMLLYRARRFSGPLGKVRAARELMAAMEKSLEGREDGWSRAMGQLLVRLRTTPDDYVYHEYLEAENAPCHFHEFAARGETHGLGYLAEADFYTYMGVALPAAQRALIGRLSADPIEFEQHADFIVDRAFRSSLLVHGAHPDLARTDPQRLKALHLTASATVGQDAEGQTVFAAVSGLKLKPNADELRAALMALVEAAPRSLAFEELCADVERRIGRSPDGDRLAADLHAALECGALTASTLATPVPASLPERPVASALARALAATHDALPTLAHGAVKLDALTRLALLYLDGSRSGAELTEFLAGELPRRGLDLRQEGRAVGKDEMARLLPGAVEGALKTLHRAALITG
ncbi:MAG TPA: class I SAM-dependent methyltransferase [Burkholderiales bacterium]|nr:class I SAM-dependent methyltransferase [Burkholderiales bacterium]